MTALTSPSQSIGQATFDVYVKTVNGDPPEAGQLDSASAGEGGWQRADNLLFKNCNYAAFPASGTAVFERVPLDIEIDPFEFGFEYGPDDQVRVIMQPPAGLGFAMPGLDQAGGDDSGICVFEGVLQRSDWHVQGATDKQDEVERFSLVATDAPSIDNLALEHLVIGRFIADDDTPTPVLVDGISVPCTFNFGGRPNKRAELTITADPGNLLLTASLFTSDGDLNAEYWTFKEALKHLIACWMYGIDEADGGDAQGDLNRSFCLEPETHRAVFGNGGSGARWAGLDKLLPETDVQGLGVLSAIERVCAHAGYRVAVLPPLGRDGEDNASIDRRYQLRVWRAGAGPEKQLKLQARHTVTGNETATQLLENNNVNMLRGLRDTSRIRNNIIAAGRALIETSVELKPLWHPDDVDSLSGGDVTQWHQQLPVDQDGDTYHQKHVAGGTQYEDYGYVGRLWGLDETGAFKAAAKGYTSGAYAHPDGGFDWLTHLGIDGDDDLTADRTANGVTEPIRWSKRPRRPLKLSRVESIETGRRFRLDVSEDGGSNWYELPQSAYRVITDGRFAILLNIDNLAATNRFSFGEQGKNVTAEPGADWYSLLLGGTNLRFRLTCLVEADHAARFDAPIDPGATSRTPRAQRIDTRITEVWQSPSSVIGDGSSWARLDDGYVAASAAGADRTNNLKDLAERVRDERGQMRFSITGETFIMDPSQFAVGDVVTEVNGRVVWFDQFNAGSGETRYPSIVSMQISGYPSQNIGFDIGDEAARRGV